ncbi:MAG: hypothetical protein M3400_13325, partial [Actinomycetota bacterium]|nr:hypothetical protein [Actinomycetota bacterium]
PEPQPMRIQLAHNYARVQHEFSDTTDRAFQRMCMRSTRRGGFPVLAIIDDRSDTMLNRVQREMLAKELDRVLGDSDLLGDAAPIIHKVLLAIEFLERGQRKFLGFVPPVAGPAVPDGVS